MPDIEEMREKLLTMYPDGVIRGQYILQMPDHQVYAIYKSHVQRKIPMNKPRIIKQKQVPGQISMLGQM